MPIRAVIFDLDDTLVDTSVLAPLRDQRRWRECFARLDEVAVFEVPGSIAVTALPEEVRSRGLATGLLTHSPSRYAETLMRRFGLKVDQRITGSDGYAPKPDPTGLRAVAESLGAPPEDCVYVGDSVGDFGAAAAAGMTSVGVAWDGHAPADWAHGWPDIAIKRPRRLLELIDGDEALGPLAETLVAGRTPHYHWGSIVRLGGGIFALGRYFTTSDRRAVNQPLSHLVLDAKNHPEAATRVASIFETLAARSDNPPQIVASVPPKPDADYDRFDQVRATLAETYGCRDGRGLLRMNFDVPDYKHIPRDQRSAVNADRFEVTESLDGERVLLIDDVINSSSQADACRRALGDAGASRVVLMGLTVSQERLLDTCPNCGGNLRVKTRARDGKRFVGCSNFRTLGCYYSRELTDPRPD